MSDQRPIPHPVTAPDFGMELCYECEGKRICWACDGQGAMSDGKRCFTCAGRGWCIVCNGAGQLREGTKASLP
jgi:hypothetical protein